MTVKNNESEEMYLETILLLSKKLNNIRAVDICNERNFVKSSVSKALSLLSSKNYVNIDKNGYVTLTESGKQMAERVYEKHQLITRAFMGLGVSKEIAEEDACRVEHVISDQLFEVLKEHIINNYNKNK